MRRRSYLAAAAAGAFAGCLATDGDDPSNGDDGDDDAEAVAGPDDGETFDDFERLGNWSVVAGSLHRVTEDAVAGSQSALLRSDGEDRVRIVRELSPPVDFSGLWPGLSLATDAPASPTVRLVDDDGDWVDFRHRPGANTELVRANFGIDDVEGEPELERTAEIVVDQWVGEETSQLWIDDLRFLSGPATGRVMIGFDGGFEEEYTVGLPILEEFGYPATTFVNTETLREEAHHEGGRLAVPQLEGLADAGWTVASRGALEAEYPTLTEEEQAALIEEAVDWLEGRGFGDGAAYFSYPRGGYDDRTLELVESAHELGFASGFPAAARIGNPLLCPKLVEPDVETAKAAIDRTAAFGGITALCYRRPGPTSWEDFEETIAHLASLETESRLAVATPRQLETTHLH